MKEITEVARKINIDTESLIQFGKNKAKIEIIEKKECGEVILVSAMNATPYGEGKTTVAIGLNDAFNKLGFKSVSVLREPSIGPVFGAKGGAIGGGLSKVHPSLDINLHFNGDFHAITTANNLICAVVDNSLYYENKFDLNPNEIFVKRCMDINDRSLRYININYDGKKNGKSRSESFTITAGSELMSIFCLAKDKQDLRRRIENIIVGKNNQNEFVYLKQFSIIENIMLILDNAIKPNLVQSTYENPIIIHGGPFANISTGVSSTIALKEARKICDYVITEAGFGFDLGGYKFFDIICQENNISPKGLIFVITIRAILHHGDGDLIKGLLNIDAHIESLNKMNISYIITINRFAEDSEEYIKQVQNYLNNKEIKCVVSNTYDLGENGAIELAQEIMKLTSQKINYAYLKDDSIEEKIKKTCQTVMHTDNIIYKEKALNKLKEYQSFSHYHICIAKTPFSISDNKKLLGYPKNSLVTITDIAVHNGAELIIVYMGNIITMPGLPEISKYNA